MIVEVEELRCQLGGKDVLKGVSLSIERGDILAVLGANGAGKTTLVRVLSTLVPITSGSVRIAGSSEPAHIRSSISLTGQYSAVDEELTGRENLVFFGRLAGLSRKEAEARAAELLTQFDVEAAGDRVVRTYSGGMRRRLDIACSLTVIPPLLFLDEPTTGLDPASRRSVWNLIEELATSGTSILLTTQYLEEADRLADRIAILASGKVIAEGTPGELKARYGQAFCEITMRDEEAARTLAAAIDGARAEGITVRAEAPAGYRSLVAALGTWTGPEEEIIDAGLTSPTLDDVYLALADRGDVAAQAEL